MFSRFRTVSPAPPSAVLEAAGPYSRVRRGTFWQSRAYPSTAVYAGDDVLAVVFTRLLMGRYIEFAMSVTPKAAPHMRGLVQLAHLTLAGLAESHVVFARISLTNTRGRRMAMLTGFRHLGAGSRIWIFER